MSYIKLHRSILNWQYWDDHNSTRLLIFFLVSVNYEKKTWRGIDIEAGSLVTSFDKISAQTGLSVKQIRRSIEILVKSGEVTRETTNKYQVISLVKWEELQLETDNQGTQKTFKRHSKGIQRATTKESKEIKNINNTNNSNELLVLQKLEERKEEFAKSLASFLPTYGKDLLNDFFRYWTEPNKSKTKMRFELEKTWLVSGRLATWAKRDNNFKPNNNESTSNKTGIGSADQKIAEYTKRVLERTGKPNDGTRTCEDDEICPDDFATFTVMQE